MTSIRAEELAPLIDDAVRGVGGVNDSYSARPVMSRAIDRATDAEVALAAITEVSGSRAITVCIGVAGDRDSAAVASAVADAVHRVGDDGVPVSVRVRVARLVTPAS